jgi:PEP-CTERM motif
MAGTSPSHLPDTVRSTVMTGTSTEQASFAQQSQAASAPPLQKPVTQIPEPSTTVLMLMGFAAIAWARARHTRRLR